MYATPAQPQAEVSGTMYIWFVNEARFTPAAVAAFPPSVAHELQSHDVDDALIVYQP